MPGNLEQIAPEAQMLANSDRIRLTKPAVTAVMRLASAWACRAPEAERRAAREDLVREIDGLAIAAHAEGFATLTAHLAILKQGEAGDGR